MIYTLTFTSDEKDMFRRVFEVNPEATFLDLHHAILDSCDYPDDQMTSFFICNDYWEKEQEVTLIEMDKNFEYDNMTMESTPLADLIQDEGQRLIYIFDPIFERYFMGKLTEIRTGKVEGITCTVKEGKAPKQTQEIEDIAATSKKGGDDFLDDSFYGDSFDSNDLDPDGFSDLSFEDGTMF